MTPDDIAPRVLRSIGAATFSQLWRIGVTLGTHLALRRLVPPEDWGLYDWTLVVFLVLGALRDLGMNAHTLRVQPRPMGNLLLVETVWSGLLVLILGLAAPWLAGGLAGGHPEVVPVIRAMGLFLFFEGLAMVPLIHLEGELTVGRAVAPELARNLCYASLAITLAVLGHGVWSMVIAQVTASAVFAAALWWRVRGRIHFHFHAGGTLSLLARSYRLSVIWLLVLLVRDVDKLVLGALTDARTVGTFGFANWAAFVVSLIFLQPVGRVVYPALMAYRGRRRRQLDTFRLATVGLLALEVPAAYFLFLNSDFVLRLLGGAGRWPGAADFLVILCFAPLLDPLSRLGGEVLASRHRDGWWIAATATTLAAFTLGGLVLTQAWGPRGMAWAKLLPMGGLVMYWALRQVSRQTVHRTLRELLWIYLLPLPWLALAAWASGGIDGPERGLRLGLSLLALAATAGCYLLRFGSQFRDYFRPRQPSR